MLEKILVCLDGSATAEQVLPLLTDDIARLHSKVVLLRVVRMPESFIPLNFPGEPGVPYQIPPIIRQTDAQAKEATAYLSRTAESLSGKGVDVEFEVIAGSSGEMIVEYADKNDFKAIAIAAHGHSGVRRVFVGSTAEYVLRHTKLPVILMRPQ